MRRALILVLTGPLAVLSACSDRSPTSPEKTASAESWKSVEVPTVGTDRQSRNPRVVAPRGNKVLPPGVWGSDKASVTIKGGSATVEIFSQAMPPSGCFGSYGDIPQEIPNGYFSLPGTYTQLTGAYPGKIQYPAQFSGFVEGTAMTITITVPELPPVLGPFVLTYGVTNTWRPCLYP
jgi:hypothetical protein